MPNLPLEWTSYRDPLLPGTPMRTGAADRSEVGRDQEGLHVPLARVHGSSVHGWGIGFGLRVLAVRWQPEFTIETGVAVDAEGRHVSLAAGGNAELSPQPDPLSPVSAGVSAGGIVVQAQKLVPPPQQVPDEWLITIEHWAAFDTSSPSYGTRRCVQMPWIRFQDPQSFVDDGKNGILLARVRLNVAGNIEWLVHETRRQTSLPVGTLSVRRGATEAPDVEENQLWVDNIEAAAVAPRMTTPAPSGIDIVVNGPSAEVHIQERKNVFAKFAIAARRAVFRRADGTETVVLESDHGRVTAGAQGAAGAIIVKDAADRATVEANGASGTLRVGVAGNDGVVAVVDGAGAEGVRLAGSSGDIVYRGELRDPAGSHNGVTHNELAQLTGAGLTTLHRHAIPNVARPDFALWMSSRFNIPDLGFFTTPGATPRRMVAAILLTAVDLRELYAGAGEAFLAEILSVNGTDYRTPSPAQPARVWGDPFGGNLGPLGDPANLRAPVFAGTATRVTFQLRSATATRAWALALVFLE